MRIRAIITVVKKQLMMTIENETQMSPANVDMQCRIVPAHAEWLDVAATLLRSGNIVAFPTETVYGLGANALDEAAVAKIFAAKGRPSNNPLIVHVSSPDNVEEVAVVTDRARALMAEFWPGPLTLVLPKRDTVASNVTAGGATVGVRMPAHAVALELIVRAGVPVAAPSANRSQQVSPTLAQHVLDSLGDHVPLIIDGGACKVGLESTVLDLTSDRATILRPGAISAAQISAVLCAPVSLPTATSQTTQALRSPGMMRRHYAPNTPVVITSAPSQEAALHIAPALIVWSSTSANNRPENATEVICLSANASEYSYRLYAVLRQLDNTNASAIIIEEVPGSPEWAAVRDRLRRASAPRE